MSCGIRMLSTIYLISGMLVSIFYIPQILSGARSNNGAKSLSLISWSVWFTATIIALIYAMVDTDDTAFQIVCLCNMMGSGGVFITIIYKRLTY